MPSSPSLTSTLQEHSGLTADALAEGAASPLSAEELEPLAPILPPEGITASRIRDVAARTKALGRSGRVDVAGVRGCAAASVAAAVARAGRRVVLVTADLDT
ncbi:MAG: hypothetical protein ABSE49_23510, partial [Polyangiaceae bacterium]